MDRDVLNTVRSALRSVKENSEGGHVTPRMMGHRDPSSSSLSQAPFESVDAQPQFGHQDLSHLSTEQSKRVDAHSRIDQLEHSLQVLIKTELGSLLAAMVKEVQVSKNECLAQVQDIRTLIESGHNVMQDNVRRQDDETAARGHEPQTDKVKKGKSFVSQPSDTDDQNACQNELDMWTDFQEAVETNDDGGLYNKLIMASEDTGFVHKFFQSLGIHLRTEAPNNCAAAICEHPYFGMLQALLILGNTGVMGIESDILIRSALDGRAAEGSPAWIDVCNLTFQIIFAVELVFRMIALQSWFFANPTDWGWNLFDMVIVISSLVTDILLKDIQLSFMRTLRIFRAFRAARVIRMLRFFRQLRGMLFAILACLSSLLWFFLFLGLIMFMTSIFLLQGLVFSLGDLDLSTPEGMLEKQVIDTYFGSVFMSMFSLLAAISGGNDWTVYEAPLENAGWLYVAAFVFYVLFVTIGIINVLTGVFIESAGDFTDESLIIQNEQVKLEGFAKQMMDLFTHLDATGSGKITWEVFRTALQDKDIQAYLSYHDLEPTHARLIFDFLDDKEVGEINVRDFVMGMMRLKGEAKAVDARIIQRQLTMLPSVLHHRVKGIAHHKQ